MLIVEALDGPATFADLARWSGLSQPRINQIVARRGSA